MADCKTNLTIIFAALFKCTDRTVHGGWTPAAYKDQTEVVPPQQLRLHWCGNCTCCKKKKQTTLVFRATTASASSDKLITLKWNCALIPQGIAVSDCCSQPHPDMGLIMESPSGDNTLGRGCPVGTSNYDVLWQGYKYPWSHRWSPHCSRVFGQVFTLFSLPAWAGRLFVTMRASQASPPGSVKPARFHNHRQIKHQSEKHWRGND